MIKDKKEAFKKAQARYLNSGQEYHKNYDKISLTVNMLTALETEEARAKRVLRQSLSSRQKDMN